MRKIKGTKNKAWKVFSEYVRRKGNGVCYICGFRYWNEELGENDWKRMHAGHFIHNHLDFDTRNVKCCCPQCNTFKHGNLGNYAKMLVNEYGAEILMELDKAAVQEKPIKDYTPLLEKYQKLLSNL